MSFASDTVQRFRTSSPIDGHVLDDDRVATWVSESADPEVKAAAKAYRDAAAAVRALQERQPALQSEMTAIDLQWLDANADQRKKLTDQFVRLNAELTAFPRIEPLALARLRETRRVFIDLAIRRIADEANALDRKLAPATEEVGQINELLRRQPLLRVNTGRMSDEELAKTYARRNELSVEHKDDNDRRNLLNDMRSDLSLSAA